MLEFLVQNESKKLKGKTIKFHKKYLVNDNCKKKKKNENQAKHCDSITQPHISSIHVDYFLVVLCTKNFKKHVVHIVHTYTYKKNCKSEFKYFNFSSSILLSHLLLHLVQCSDVHLTIIFDHDVDDDMQCNEQQYLMFGY